MSIIVSGRTSAAYGNPHRRQTLAGATLYFYAASADDEVGRLRWGFHPWARSRSRLACSGRPRWPPTAPSPPS